MRRRPSVDARALTALLLLPLVTRSAPGVAQRRPTRVQLLVTSVAGAASSAGFLPNGVAFGTLARERGLLERCYARAVVAEPTPDGTVLLRFALAPDGAVTEVSVEPSGAVLSRCLGEVVRATRFAAPEGGAATFVATLYLRRVP